MKKTRIFVLFLGGKYVEKLANCMVDADAVDTVKSVRFSFQ